MIVLKHIRKAGSMRYVSIPLAVLFVYLEMKNSPTKKTSTIPKTMVTFVVCALRFSARYPGGNAIFVGSITGSMANRQSAWKQGEYRVYSLKVDVVRTNGGVLG